MKRLAGLAVAVLAAAMLNGACSHDDPDDYCHCWCDCGAGLTRLDVEGSSLCIAMCRDECGADYVEGFYECAD